jgi:5-methylthioadenosine/S-adenosylhomocysteine deaminase
MIISSTKTIGLIGNVFDPVQGETLKTLIIANGKIARVMDGRQPLTDIPGIAIIILDDRMTIFPGLINLHTHTTYNILPIWESRQVWANRFQWRNNQSYKEDIGGLLDYIQSNWKDDPCSSLVNNAYAIISEIQAVAGGTTLIQETLSLDKEAADDRSFIIRNTGDQADLQITATEQVFSVVDFYEPDLKPDGTPDQDTSNWLPVKQSTYDEFARSVNNNNSTYYATLVHVGEGKSGFVKNSSPDPYSKKEMALLFQSLSKDIPDSGNLQKANLVLTHGCGIDMSNDDLLESMAANHISLIWSPVSNLLLYRDTTDISKLLDKKINICLGSDWSPSGSKHVLDELKFAKFVNDLLGMGISNDRLFSMVTTNPVKAMGIAGTGAIRENYDADLFVLRKQDHTDNALDALFASTDNDIEFVMVNGRIVFGLTSYFDHQLKVDYQGFSPKEGSHIARRGVSINSNLHFDLAGSLNIIDTLMHQYCSTVIDKPHLKRTRFLASDDTLYQHNITTLKWQLAEIYQPGSGHPTSEK